MRNYPLVGLIGKKRAGKDTFARVLVEEFGYRRIAFADPLKDVALELDPLVGPASLMALDSGAPKMHRLSDVVDVLGWEAAKDTVPEVRRTLQHLGQAVRKYDPEFWLRIGLQEAFRTRLSDGLDSPGRPVVITDVRMRNEAEAIQEEGGLLVRILRPRHADDEDSHISERDLDGYDADVEVWNDSTIEALQESARRFARSMR